LLPSLFFLVMITLLVSWSWFSALIVMAFFLLFLVVITLLVSWPWFLVVIVVTFFSIFLGHDSLVGFLIVVFHSLTLFIFLFLLIMNTLLVSLSWFLAIIIIIFFSIPLGFNYHQIVWDWVYYLRFPNSYWRGNLSYWTPIGGLIIVALQSPKSIPTWFQLHVLVHAWKFPTTLYHHFINTKILFCIFT